MATIKQIAELAGVSRGTVDRVLNNRGSVNANTAARVREIAEKLNYKPNKAGLMLAAQKKNLKIGVILFPDSNPFFSEVLEGVNAKAKELSAYNFTVLIRQVPFDETEQFNTMEALLAEGINGLVIAPFNSLYIAAEIDRLTEMNIPVITVNTDILSRRIAYVGSNYRLSGQTAAGLVSLMTFGEIHWPEGPVDYIVHAACPTASRFFAEHPVETADAIVLGTRRVLELARAKGSSGVVYASSMEAYGDGNERPGLEPLLDESRVGYVDPMRVRSCYPEGKRMAEQYCCAYASEYVLMLLMLRHFRRARCTAQ